MEQSKKGKMFDIKTIILSTVIAIAASSISVYASNYLFASSEVSYDNTNSGLASTNVQEALDELYGDATDYTSIEQRVSVLEASQLSLDDIYPVGSIYITATESDVSAVETKFGGSWEAYGQGRTLVGMGSNGTNNYTTVGATGGATTTTLITDNLPSHSHTISHTHTTPSTTITSSGAHTHSTNATTTTIDGTTNNTLTAKGAGAHSHTVNVRYGGVDNGSSGGNTFGLQLGSGYYTGHLVLGAQANKGTWATAQQGTTAATGANHTHNVTGTIKIPALSIGSSGAHEHTVPTMTTNSQSTTSSGNTGSGTAFSVQDPYITVYMYKRIS